MLCIHFKFTIVHSSFIYRHRWHAFKQNFVNFVCHILIMQWKGMKEPKEKSNMMKNNGMGSHLGQSNEQKRTHACKRNEREEKNRHNIKSLYNTKCNQWLLRLNTPENKIKLGAKKMEGEKTMSSKIRIQRTHRITDCAKEMWNNAFNFVYERNIGASGINIGRIR